MPTKTIVKALNELEDTTTRLLMGLKNRARSTFVFERAKETLHHGIVVTVARTAHADLNALGSQQLQIAITGVLATPIRVMQQLGTDLSASQGHLQGLRDEGFILGGRHRPARNG
jgi:hypothetical protein